MISTDISLSEKVEACSDFAQSLFKNMIAHQDEWGRMVGSPIQVKARMKPLDKRHPEKFADAIGELARVGLICWYEIEGDSFIAMKPSSFEEYQSSTHTKAVSQGRSSKYPAPPVSGYRWEEDGAMPDNPEYSSSLLDSSAINKDNINKIKIVRKSPVQDKPARSCPFCEYRMEHNGEQNPLTPKFRHQRIHDAACRVLGVSCFRLTEKDYKLLKSAAQRYGETELDEWWQDFLAKPCDIGHTIPAFNSRLQRYSELHAKRHQNVEDLRP
jgi:hypothetical protein